MNVKYLAQALTFLCAVVSLNGLTCTGGCSSTTISASMGSDVSLPCSFQKSNTTSEAKWSQTFSLLNLTSEGIITFQDPRGGRVTAFPCLFHRGNFSILIRALQDSDLGTYCCELSGECQVVELSLDQARGLDFPWIYVVIGVSIFTIFLVSICCLSIAIKRLCKKPYTDTYYVNSSHKEENCSESAKRPETEEHDGDYVEAKEEVDEDDYVNIQTDEGERCQGAYSEPEPTGLTGDHDDPTVYENDEHNPDLNRRLKTRPHLHPEACRETTNQQSHTRAPYYANQSEIQKAAKPGKRRQIPIQSEIQKAAKPGKRRQIPNQSEIQKAAEPGKRRQIQYQVRNPIYGDSTRHVEESHH